MNIDLHCHSHYSDGSLPPKEVMQLASNNNVDVIALTDHDSIKGLESAEQEAHELGIQFIPGIEFSAAWQDAQEQTHSLHIVGLNVDRNDLKLLDCINKNQRERQRRAQLTLEKLKDCGIELHDTVNTYIPDEGIITRTHIARALIENGHVKNFDQVFKKYLGKGKRAFVQGQWQSLSTVIKAINSSGGVAVIAHPMRYRLNATKLDQLTSEFSQLGGKAIEVVTATQDVNQQARALQLAKLYKLHASIGSDFHSLDQPWAMLGKCKPLPKNSSPVWELFI